MATVVLLGTLDTKGIEYEYVRLRIQAEGCTVILVDAGILGTPQVQPDISREEVAQAAQVDLPQLVAAQDRGTAIEAMTRGAIIIIKNLYERGRLNGIMGLGGSGNSSLVTTAMQALPVAKRMYN